MWPRYTYRLGKKKEYTWYSRAKRNVVPTIFSSYRQVKEPDHSLRKYVGHKVLAPSYHARRQFCCGDAGRFARNLAHMPDK